MAFRDLPTAQPPYPCVGLRTPGEQLDVNFGQRPFRFDISRYIEDERARLQAEIAGRPLLCRVSLSGTAGATAATAATGNNDDGSTGVHEQAVLESAVLQHLLYHGYTGAARAFAAATATSGAAGDHGDLSREWLAVALRDAEQRRGILYMLLLLRF